MVHMMHNNRVREMHIHCWADVSQTESVHLRAHQARKTVCVSNLRHVKMRHSATGVLVVNCFSGDLVGGLNSGKRGFSRICMYLNVPDDVLHVSSS